MLESLEDFGNRWRDRAVEADLEIKRLQAEMEEGRTEYRKVIGLAAGYITAIERARALHERYDCGDGSAICGLCSNHGDLEWPCATINALGPAEE